jgi:hypothetical protein
MFEFLFSACKFRHLAYFCSNLAQFQAESDTHMLFFEINHFLMRYILQKA